MSPSPTKFNWLKLPDRYPQLYERINQNYGRFYSVAAEQLVKLANLKPGQTTIDLGCGSGISTEPIARAVGEKGTVIGIDPSAAMLAKARERFIGQKQVSFVTLDGYDIEKFAKKREMLGQVEAVLSNFTYYYFLERRQELHRSITRVLRKNGRWVFNLPSYFTEIEFEGQRYNTFSRTFNAQLEKILAEQGHGKTVSLRKVNTPDEELDLLRRSGYSNVEVEVFSLPMLPSEAYEFTIEGFFQFGAPPANPVVAALPLRERIAVLSETLERSRGEMDMSDEQPTIFNFVARP